MSGPPSSGSASVFDSSPAPGTKTSQDHKRLPRVHLIRCRGVKLFLPKDFFRNWLFQALKFWVLSKFVFFSFIVTYFLKFCHNLSLWICPQFEIFSLVTFRVFKCFHNFRFCVLSQLECLSCVAIWVFALKLVLVMSHLSLCVV